MELIDRFIDRRVLVEALSRQCVAAGDRNVAADLAAVTKLTQHAVGTHLTEQAAHDNHLLLILAGEVAICVNGQEIARRRAGQHVGEMAMIDAGASRSATIIAREAVVVAEVSEADFSCVAHQHPSMWRQIACELGDRLRQRGRFIRERNITPIMFIGSSSESLPVVKCLVEHLVSEPVITRPWTSGVFAPSQFPIDDLAKQLVSCDFAALVLGPDDEVLSRGATANAPRDNVLLELGLFMGALERSRVFFIVPRDVDVKIPSDILGLTPLKFNYKTGLMTDNIKPVSKELATMVKAMGPR